jgi:hypothetical protein
LGKALARRIADDRDDAGTDDQIPAPQDDVTALRHQLQETQERVEFAERPPEPPGALAGPPALTRSGRRQLR